ncbi:MAG: YciI family protein [Chloroherpetonaceae bacterium]|nr:YciI family protein [Chloroherpetonaceae bacterium]
MNKYMLLFRDLKMNDEAFASLSPKDMQASLEEWGKWMGKLAAEGKLLGGEPLLPFGKVIRGTIKKITDGPFMESKEIVGGYLIINAASLEEATELAKDCPTLKSADGSVEIREIMIVNQQ